MEWNCHSRKRMLGLPFIYNKLAKEGTTPAKASSTQVAADPHQQTLSSCAGGVRKHHDWHVGRFLLRTELCFEKGPSQSDFRGRLCAQSVCETMMAGCPRGLSFNLAIIKTLWQLNLYSIFDFRAWYKSSNPGNKIRRAPIIPRAKLDPH